MGTVLSKQSTPGCVKRLLKMMRALSAWTSGPSQRVRTQGKQAKRCKRAASCAIRAGAGDLFSCCHDARVKVAIRQVQGLEFLQNLGYSSLPNCAGAAVRGCRCSAILCGTSQCVLHRGGGHCQARKCATQFCNQDFHQALVTHSCMKWVPKRHR
jgi:hypothetical protein